MDLERLHRRARERRANPVVYGIVRLSFQPFFHLYFRFQRIGREHIPARDPVIIASNHRSFLDPFVIACMARRPMYYVTKKEIFLLHPALAWLLASLGAFPVDRGAGDADMIETARAILARGDIVLIFVEGTRIRPGPLGRPRRGVGRLALETGVPVVPLAVHGTEAVRRGWRIRPHKVRIRAGRPLRFPRIEEPSPELARAVTERIWPCVMLQWEWLGGAPPARRATVLGAGARGTALAVCLARAGLEVELRCRSAAHAEEIRRTGENANHLPGVRLPASVKPVPADDPWPEDQDIVALAVPSSVLPEVLDAHGLAIPHRAGVLVLSRGLVPPLGTLPSAYVAERWGVRSVAVLTGPARPAELLDEHAPVVLGSVDRALGRQLADVLAGGGLTVTRTSDVTGVEMAACARTVAAVAAAAAAPAGPEVAGAIAERVSAEVEALARARGGRSESFGGTPGADPAAEAPSDEPAEALDAEAEAARLVPLLVRAAREAHLPAPTLERLAALLTGEIDVEDYAITPAHPGRERHPTPSPAA